MMAVKRTAVMCSGVASMHGSWVKKLNSIWCRTFFTLTAVLFLFGCTGGPDFYVSPMPTDMPAPTPTGPPAISIGTPETVDTPIAAPELTTSATPAPERAGDTMPNPTPIVAVVEVEPTPKPTPTPPVTPALALAPLPAPAGVALTLLSPQDESGIELGVVRVWGSTHSNATVTVNRTGVDVTDSGAFQRDLTLKEGINSIEVVASSSSGDLASEILQVLYIPSTADPPLSVFYPYGDEVSQPNIQVIGATRVDAIVGVNGIPVDVNPFGIFATAVSLQEGANLIEVVAVDLDGDVNYRMLVVFYIP